MKRILVTISILLLLGTLSAQEVEKSLWQAQLGLLGGWVNNELGVVNNVVLRSEVGLIRPFPLNDLATNHAFVPVFTLEPRWYYSLRKRSEKGRKTAYNSGNFVSLSTSYNTPKAIIGGHDGFGADRKITVSTLWGIRRSFGRYLNVEAATGLRFYLMETGGARNWPTLDLSLRIGSNLW